MLRGFYFLEKNVFTLVIFTNLVFLNDALALVYLYIYLFRDNKRTNIEITAAGVDTGYITILWAGHIRSSL